MAMRYMTVLHNQLYVLQSEKALGTAMDTARMVCVKRYRLLFVFRALVARLLK